MVKMHLSRCHIAIFLLAIIIITFAFSVLPVSAAQTGKDSGWIEIRATVPDSFNRSIIVSVENTDTLATHDIELLAINNYVASKQLPAGNYTVSMAFVYQNYTYHVVVDAPEFTVVSDGAAALLNVTVSEGEEVDLSADPSTEPDPSQEPIPTDDPSVEEIEPTPSTTDTLEDPNQSTVEDIDTDDSFSGKTLIISAIGSVLFAGLIFGVLYVIRKHFNS